MADESAVLDAPIVDEVEQEAPALEAPESVEAAAPVVEAKGDERTLPQWIRNLKAVDPAGFREAKDTFFGKRTLEDKLKDFDLDGTKSFLEEQGGRDAIVATISDLKANTEQLQGIQKAFSTGDPKIVDDMVALSPEGFAKLAPVMMDKWQQADPQAWSHSMTGVLAATLMQESESGESVAGVIKDLGVMLKYGDAEGVKQAVAKLQGWTNHIVSSARAPRPQPQATQKQDANSEVEDLRTKVTNSFGEKLEYQMQPVRDQEIKAELDGLTKDKSIPSGLIEVAQERINERVNAAILQDAKFRESLRNFALTNNIDGATRVFKTRQASLVKQFTAEIGGKMFRDLPAVVKKAAAAPAIKKASTSGFAGKKDRFDAVWNQA